MTTAVLDKSTDKKFEAQKNLVGERIRDLRDAKELTQKDIAKYLGKSRSSIAQWEGGNAFPDLMDFNRLAVLLNTTPQYLAFGVSDAATTAVLVPVVDYSDNGKRVGKMALDRSFLKRLGVEKEGHLKAYALPRDRMLGEYRRGDLIIVDESVKQPDAIGGDTFLFEVEGSPQVVTVLKHPKHSNSWVVTYGNQRRPFELKGKLPIIGKIISVVTGNVAAAE